jgi:hypothetical protein
MRAAIFNGPRDLTVGERPDPTIENPTDGIVRLAATQSAMDAPIVDRPTPLTARCREA